MTPAPLTLALDSWPNPAASSATIRFALGLAQPVALSIYDAGGRLVRTLLRGPLAAGPHTLAWPGTDAHGNPVPAGVYFYRLDADGGTVTRKLMWLR
jgi:flagellar hook assembly protein FlgD